MDVTEIPLFPLGMVLFDGGRLPLKIFEPRYLDMVGRCMREESGFGVVLIREGRDAHLERDDPPPSIFDVGTSATIVDFHPMEHGMLGIVAAGGGKFRVLETWFASDHLMMGRVELLPPERSMAVAEQFHALVDILEELMQHPTIKQLGLAADLGDAHSVSCILAELLPLEPEIKQSLLKMRYPPERLAELNRLVTNMRG